MARAIWSGVLSFGLVTVPVELYSATEAHEPTFHQFEKGTNDRIRYQRVNERTGKEVDFADIVKGAEAGRGKRKYVMLEQDELDAVAPGRSRSMEIDTFVDLEDIDPIHFAKTYYLGPNGAETKKTYALLRDALAGTNKAAIVKFVMRGKEYLAAIRADGNALALETLFFADEIRDPKKEIADLPGKLKLSPQELRMARQLIDSMSGEWRPTKYRDTYTERVNKLISAKRHDREFTPAEDAPEPTNVTDLLAALRRSVDAAKGGRGSAGVKKAVKKASKRAPAKKPAKNAAAKKAAAKKAAAKKAAAKKATTRKTTARKTTAKKKRAA